MFKECEIWPKWGGVAEWIVALIEMAIITHFIDYKMKQIHQPNIYDNYIVKELQWFDRMFWNDDQVAKEVKSWREGAGNYLFEYQYIEFCIEHHIVDNDKRVQKFN